MKLYLPNSFHELCVFTCKEPIYIDVYYVDRKTKAVHFEWDFGMDASIGLNSFTCKNIKGLKKKIYREVVFDLGHAFCHYEGDPNYTDYHWALKGWLKDRLQVHEHVFSKY
jgi:hypothetical protein